MAITVSTLRANFTAETADLEQGVARAARASDKAAGDIRAAGSRSEGAFDGLSAKAVALGGVLSTAITGGLGLAISGFQSAVNAGAGFGATLNKIQAVGGATADQLAAINDKALELGAKLPISAQEGADGMLALVAGGMSVEQALSAVEGVAGFAAAQMLDVGSAAEIVSGSLTSFGLGADQASYAADIMSQVANSSAADVRDWGESIKYVGPVAGALKQPIEDMGVAIGLMANQSIKGSSAGTALRTILTNLAAPSKEVATALGSMGVETTNAAGQMLPFIGIAEQMRGKMASMTDVQKAQIAETIAGKEGMSGFLAIVNAAPGDFDKMKQSMASAQGATEEFAKATNKGFAFEWGQLQGSIETVLIQGFQAVEPVLSSLTGVATGFVNAIGGGLASIAPMIGDVADMVNEIVASFQAGGIAEGAASIAGTLGFGPEVQGQVQAVMQGVQNAVAAGISQVQSVIASAGPAWDMFTEAASGIASQVGSALSQIASVVGGVLGSAFQTAGAIARDTLGSLPGLFWAIAGPAQAIASSVGSFLVSAFQSVGSIAQSVMGVLPSLVQTAVAVFTSFASFITSTLASAFQIILPIATSVFAGIATVVQTALPGVMSLANAIGSMLIVAFGALQDIAVSVFAAIQPYIPAVQAAIGNLAAAVGGVLNSAFQAAAGFVTGTVVPALTNLGTWLAANLPTAIQTLANFWTSVLLPAISTVAGWVTGTLFPALGVLFNWLQAQIPVALQTLSNFWQGTLLPAIQTVAGWVTGTLFPLFGQLVTWLTTTITGGLQTLSNFWQQHGDTILTTAQQAWQGIQTAVDTVLAAVEMVWTAWNSAREGNWRDFGANLRAIWDGVWDALKNAVTTLGPQVVSAITTVVTDAKNAFTAIDWGQIGRNIVEGVAKGISAGAGLIADAAKNAAKAALDAAKGFLGISSPSQEMYDQVGVPMVQGLVAGFVAAMSSVGIPTVVGGMRSLLEQISAVLQGIGGSISNSSFEKFRDAATSLSDGLTAIADAAKLFSGGGLVALSSVSDQIKTFAQDARTLLESIDLAGIGRISNSNFEKFAAGLKELASSMASIASIGATFASDTVMPDLKALAGQIKTLTVDARALLVELDGAIEPISAGLPEKLKNLGDTAAAAKVILDNAMGMLSGMYAFASDSIMIAIVSSVGARAWFARLAAALGQFVEDALEAFNRFDVDVAQTLTDRAARVAAGATHAGQIVDGAIGMISSLFTFASTAINLAIIQSVGARAWFANLAAALGQFVEDALEAFDTFGVDVSQELITQASRVGAGADELNQIIGGAINSITTLFKFAGEEALVAAVTSTEARENLAMLGAALGQFVEDMLEFIDTFDVAVTQGMVDAGQILAAGAGAVLGLIRDAVDTFVFIRDTLADGPLDMSDADIHPEFAAALAQYAINVAQEFLLTANTFTGELTDAARALGGGIGLVLGVVSDAFDALTGFNEMLADGPLDMTGADIHPEFAAAMAQYAIDVATEFLLTANTFTGEILDAARDLGSGVGLVLGVVTDAFDALLAFNEMLVNGPLDMTSADIHAELADALTTYIMGVAAAFLIVANGFTGEILDAAQVLVDGAGMAIGVVTDAYDALLAFNEMLASGPLDMTSADIHAELADALTTYISAVAAAFLLVANEFTGEILDAAGVLVDAAGLAMGMAKDALDALALFNEALLDGPVDMTGADIHAELVDALTTYAVGIATAFLLVANTFDGIVTDAALALGDAMGEATSVVKEVLDFNEMHEALTNFRGFDMAVLGPKLALIFSAAVAIATEFGRRANASGIKEAWVEAGEALSSRYGDAASTLKDALDLGASLLDPETQIPSIGQIQGKVDALFNVIQAIAAQFATRATAAASAGMNFEQVRTYAETVKGVFESIREVAAAVADFTGVSLGASGFNNISQVLNAVFTLFEQVAGRASVVSQVSAAIATVLGGLANMVSAQSFQAGVDIGSKIADGIAAGLNGASATIGAAILTAVSSGDTAGRGLGTPGVAPGGGVGGGSVVNNYYTNNSTTKNLTVQQIINTTPAGIGPASNSLYGLLAGN